MNQPQKSNPLRMIAIENESIFYHGAYGMYDDNFEEVVDISKNIIHTFDSTFTIIPDDLDDEFEIIKSQMGRFDTTISVHNEGAVKGAQTLCEEHVEGILVLNFASARQPGGGYLNGAIAQEEDLCRCSMLYYFIKNQSEFYNKYDKNDPKYSDLFIMSSFVPFIRDENYNLLDRPFYASVITYAAPNNENCNIEKGTLYSIFSKRIRHMLNRAALEGIRHLVLGAWGCGVFNNDPKMVAEIFNHHLKNEYKGMFKTVRFSVLDKTLEKKTFETFKMILTP